MLSYEEAKRLISLKMRVEEWLPEAGGWEGKRTGKGWLVDSIIQGENILMFYNHRRENIIYDNLLYISK